MELGCDKPARKRYDFGGRTMQLLIFRLEGTSAVVKALEEF